MENTFPFQTNEKLASVLNLGLKFDSDIDLVFRRRRLSSLSNNRKDF